MYMKIQFLVKRVSAILFLAFILNSITSLAQENTEKFWTEADSKTIKKKNKKVKFPSSYKAFTLDGEKMKTHLNNAPKKKDKTDGYIVSLPLPDGSWETFAVYSNSTMSKELAAKYPDINTYDAVGKSKSLWTGKLDYTTKGFHALLHNGANEIYIQPIKEGDLTNYIVFYKKDAIKKGKYIYESKTSTEKK